MFGLMLCMTEVYIRLSYLAVANQYIGNLPAAGSFSQGALELGRRLYGNANPIVAEALSNFATAEASSGKFTEAEGLYDQAAAILSAYFGSNNPETIQVESFSASMALRAGDYSKAETLLDNVLLVQEQEYGSSPNPNISFTHYALGQLAMAKGNLRTAETEFEASAKINSLLYGDLDLKTAQTLSNLAHVLAKEGQYGRAERAAQQAVKALTQRPLPGNVNVGLAELYLGEALLGEKRFHDAEEPLSQAYDQLKAAPPSFVSQLEDSRRDLVLVHEALHEPSEAARYQSAFSLQH
jgi:tetratricopeptide (TPR) repeat protein